jgi:hypothetical protein
LNTLHQFRFCLLLAARDLAAVFCSLSGSRRSARRRGDALSIPEDFFGINIATSEDERCDDYVIARLRELDIRNVRLAFSYCSLNGPAQRMLDRLLSAEFTVSLVLLPPREDAARMLTDNQSRERWRHFVRGVFGRYAGKVADFEIGSTPNRRRWSGFRPSGYLRAWQIACEEAAPRAVTLAGPNVQDFEPFYNAVILNAMRRMGHVPRIHTNNLFVERVIEPEARDHRVLGRWATDLLGFDLVKKARLLQGLGKRAGCLKTVATCQFWSTRRLMRWSVFPQEKKVDYLIRYLLLAASSGALDRVFWGPMICGRDGLIDDRACGYPKVDQSTFYRSVRGAVDALVIMPAFHALGHVARRLRGARCDLVSGHSRGARLFAFTGSDGRLFHVGWCRDGQALRLSDLYGADQLQGAVFSDFRGNPVAFPTVINERPLFIDFPGLREQLLPEHLSVMNTCDSKIIYPHLPDLQGMPWRNQAWRGAFIRSRHCPSGDLGDLLAPENLTCLPEREVLRDRRNRLWNIAHPQDPAKQLTVKFNRPRGIKRLAYLFKPSKGVRHWNTAAHMLRHGIGTPTPIAFYERHRFSGIRDSYYICEYIPDAFSSRHVCRAFSQGESGYRGYDKQQWFDMLSGFIFQMHQAGILHRDLSVGNLMLTQKADGCITPYLIDIGRARVLKEVNDRHRVLDLMRICYKLDWPDRELFIQTYCRRLGHPLPAWWRWAVRYYEFKQGGKKSAKGMFRKQR